LDVTGGILTAIGFVFAGVTVGLNRSKIIMGYESEVENGRARITEEITEKLNAYTARIKNKINDNFYRFDRLLEEEQNTISFLESEHERILVEIQEVKKEVSKSLNQTF